MAEVTPGLDLDALAELATELREWPGDGDDVRQRAADAMDSLIDMARCAALPSEKTEPDFDLIEYSDGTRHWVEWNQPRPPTAQGYTSRAAWSQPSPSLTSPPRAEAADALRDLYNAFLSRHGCFPLDRVTPEQRQWNDAMVKAKAALSTPPGVPHE